MNTTTPVSFQLFDPAAAVAVTRGRLPHWSQAGTVAFLTWRTADSIPAHALEQLLADRATWLHRHGIDPSAERAFLNDPDRVRLAREFRRFSFDRWNGDLDQSLGSCPLRDPACATVVADSLRHFDGDRYALSDFVVMPNHIHVLATFPDDAGMAAQCESWKHYTGGRLNRTLGRRGRFWQAEQFDHLVRTADQFERVRDYIAENPRKARLRPGEFVHYSVELPGSPARVAATEPHAERAGHTQGTSP